MYLKLSDASTRIGWLKLAHSFTRGHFTMLFFFPVMDECQIDYLRDVTVDTKSQLIINMPNGKLPIPEAQ